MRSPKGCLTVKIFFNRFSIRALNTSKFKFFLLFFGKFALLYFRLYLFVAFFNLVHSSNDKEKNKRDKEEVDYCVDKRTPINIERVCKVDNLFTCHRINFGCRFAEECNDIFKRAVAVKYKRQQPVDNRF